MFEGIDRLVIVYEDDMNDGSSNSSLGKKLEKRSSNVKVWRA